jgi:AcrR family transcriptional regulator
MSRATTRFRDKREAILDGAARLFNRHGVKAGKLADVASQLGLATNSLTYYYRKKEDLVAECLLRSIEAMGAAADAAATEQRFDARIRGFLHRYYDLLVAVAEGRHPELIAFSEILTVGPPHAATVVGAYNQLFRRVRELLRAPDAPALEPGPRNARAHLLLSIGSWSRVLLQRNEPADYLRVAARVADILLAGLAAPGREPARDAAALPAHEPVDGADSAATRAAYLRAATRLVNEHGYGGASVDRIAAEVKLTKGSFYHHHETKEDLIAACFDRTFAVVRAAQDAALEARGSGLDRLALACRALLAFQMSAQGPLLRVTAWNGLPDAMRSDTRRTMTRLGERFAMLVTDGMADGSLRIVDASLAAQMLSGMLNAAAEIERWVRDVDAGTAFDWYAMPLFTGLRSPPGA